MTPVKREAPDSGNASSTKKRKQQLIDDVFKAAQDQHDVDFPHAVEKRRRMQDHKNKVYADVLERQNSKQSLLLQLPQELLDEVYEYVYDDQVIEITMVNRKARLVRAINAHPLALPSTCHKLRQDTKRFPYTETTFKLVTHNFAYLVDKPGHFFRSHEEEFLDFLESLPAPYIQRFEIITLKPMKLGSYGSNKAFLESVIRKIYPEADITFQDVKDIGQL